MGLIPRYYFETTMFNFYFEEEREAHKATVSLFDAILEKKIIAFTSQYVVDELIQTRGEKRTKMLSLIEKYGITVLPSNASALSLARLYVEQNVIPEKYIMDGMHIAIAAVNGLHAVISMNYQHIVKKKTKQVTGIINAVNGYHPIDIFTPMEVLDDD